MRKIDIPQFEQDLLFSLRETLVSQNLNLTVENYKSLLKRVLYSILQNNDYRFITRNNRARESISKYDRRTILNYLCTKISNKSAIKKDYTYLVIEYSTNIFPYIISDEYLQNYPLIYDDSIENGISSVNFYKPSNLCKEMVLSGKQLKVSSSSISINNMNAYSSIGKVRKNQEDSYYIGAHPKNNQFKIMLVADGMGGHNAGDMASSVLTKNLIDWFEKLNPTEFYSDNNDNLIKMLETKINEVDYELKKDYPSSGTTLCMCIIKNNNILMINIGDSKGFILKNNKMIYTTIPDNWPNAVGIQDPFDRFHKYSNEIVNNIGDNENGFSLKYKNIEIKPNNDYKIVICSDGVTDLLSNKEVADIIASCDNVSDVSSKLVEIALNTDSSFQDYFKKYFGSIIGRHTYRVLYKNLLEARMDENFEKIIIGGKDNTTAVAGHIIK